MYGFSLRDDWRLETQVDRGCNHLNFDMHALKQQRNVLGIGALASADKVKPGTSEANVRTSREELISTDLLKSHSPCAGCRNSIQSEPPTVTAAQLASQTQSLGRSTDLLNHCARNTA